MKRETWRSPRAPFTFGETAHHGAVMVCECGRKMDATAWTAEIVCDACTRRYRIERRAFVLVESRPKRGR